MSLTDKEQSKITLADWTALCYIMILSNYVVNKYCELQGSLLRLLLFDTYVNDYATLKRSFLTSYSGNALRLMEGLSEMFIVHQARCSLPMVTSCSGMAGCMSRPHITSNFN